MGKLIITCAITGSIHTPTMSPHLPISAEQITRQSVDAAEAGASILHLHARDPANGYPSARAEHFMAFLTPIRQQTDAILNLTTGGSAFMSLDERLEGSMLAEPEMCSLNMGSMNFALYPAVNRFSEWEYDWEKPFLESSENLVFKNTPSDIAYVLTELGEKRGARFEFECYDVGHLYMLRHFADRGLATAPFFIQFVFGVLGGIGADAENLVHMKRVADKLFGDGYMFSVLAAGRHQMPLATLAATMGGHVRVGLEDSIFIEKGKLAQSNAEQVLKIREIVERLGYSVTTPTEVREMLKLKGLEQVAF